MKNNVQFAEYLKLFFFIFTGFSFRPDEPTALIQWEGGPCAVLAPVQAFIIKTLITETWNSNCSNWREVNPGVVMSHFSHFLSLFLG